MCVCVCAALWFNICSRSLCIQLVHINSSESIMMPPQTRCMQRCGFCLETKYRHHRRTQATHKQTRKKNIELNRSENHRKLCGIFECFIQRFVRIRRIQNSQRVIETEFKNSALFAFCNNPNTQNGYSN